MDRNMVWPPPHHHHRRGHSMGSGVREKDEDLALFKDMGKRDKTPFLYPSTDDQFIDASLSTKYGGLTHPQSAPPVERKGIGAELLNSDVDKTDYDWLMTPPGTPLFPSLDADSPALQHGALINRSLAAIKTSRVSTAGPRSNSPAPNLSRGNPSPSRRPSTPQNGPPSAAGTRSHNQLPAKQASNNRPATPTRSSTPTASRASSNLQARPSTPTRQNSAPARPVTPLGARPATPTSRRPASPISSGRPSSTPTLRRSSSSPTGSQPGVGGSARRNPSPARSTASTGTSARGISPARSGPSRGVSPVRGVSPAPSRGRSPSPSLRAPYPVEASDDIPPNLRTTSDRPSSAQRRAVAYGASPGEGRTISELGVDPTQRRTPSPARSAAPSLSSSILSRNRDRASRAASSDSESSFDTCSQSGVSTHGLVTPERSGSRGRMFGRGSDDYGRSSSLQKARRSSTSPQFGPSASKKSFESAAREYHRGQVAAFRPLMTNSSISTFYSSRASGLLRRPLTPSSTASSSEHGATVAHDSEVDDEDAGSTWKPSNRQVSSGAHSPLHLFDKSLSDAALENGTLDATSIVDNDELSSFFRTPEALEADPLELNCLAQVASNRRDEESQEICNAELNWLSKNEHVEDREYLWSRDVKDVDINDGDGAAGAIVQGSKQGPSGLDKIRDKLRHLKSTTENEDVDPAAKVQQSKCDTDSLYASIAPAAPDSVAGTGSLVVSSTVLQGTCEVCCYRRAGPGETSESWPGCHCSSIATSLPFHEAHEGGSARPSLAGGSSMESPDSNSKLANMVYGKEKDIWYIYRHSSEYEVPVAGFSETKMETDPPQLLAKEVHMRVSAPLNHDLSRGTESSPASRPTSVSPRLESGVKRGDMSPTDYCEKSGYPDKSYSKEQKEHVKIEEVSMEVPRNECLISDLAEGGKLAAGAILKGKELDQQYLEGLAIEAQWRGLEVGDHINRRMSPRLSETHVDAGSKSVPQTGITPEGGGEQRLKQAFNEPEKANQKLLDQKFDNERTQACASSNNVSKPLQMTSEPPQNPQIPAINSSPVPDLRATVVTPMSHSSSAEKKPEVSGQPTSSTREGHEEYGVPYLADVEASQVLHVNRSHTSALIIAEEHRHSRTESSRPAKEETNEKMLPVHVRITRTPPTADIGSCIEARWNEDHALVMPEVKETWHEEGLQSQTAFGAGPEADVPSRADEHEQTYREPGDEVAFIDIPVDSCGRVTAARVSDAVSKHSVDTRLLNAPLSPSSKPQGHCLKPHILTEKKSSGLQDGCLTYNNGETLKQLSYQEAQENIKSADPHVLEKNINMSTEHFDTPAGDVWNSLKLPHTGHRADIVDTREAQKEKSERAQHGSGAAAEITGNSGKPFRRSGSAMQGSFSKSSSSKSSFRTPTSGSSIDLSRSTDTTSSCPSNASWEDPHLYGSKFWDSRSASDIARVSDVSEPAPLLLTKVFTADSAFEETDAAKNGAHEVLKVGDLISYNGALQQSNPELNIGTHNIVDQRLRASPDETVSTPEHFDYIFECLGSKRDPSPRAEEFPVVSKVMPGATISPEDRNSANHVIARPYFNSDSHSTAKVNGATKCSEVSHKDMMIPKSHNIRETIKNNSRAADSELPVVVSSSPNSKVAVEAPMKVEEIVESAESPSPGTRKHMSSFKFSHKKSANAELKRSNTTFTSSSGSGSGASKLGTQVGNGQQSGDSGTPGSKTTVNTKLNGKPASPSPHLNKGRSVRAASPARPLAAANAAKAPAEPAGAHGEVAPEEPSLHSRFSNITVRSGSDTENFDWGRSSLEETSSRCGSSSGTNTASMAVLRTSPPQLRCHEVDAMTNAESCASGDDDDEEEEEEEEEEERQQASDFSPSRRNAEMQSEASPCFYDGATDASATTILNYSERDSRSNFLDSAHHLPEQAGVDLDLDQKLSPETSTALPVMNPVPRPRASSVNNYAPKQNLDKLSEKLEQLETFGARVMLRNPQQQFLHSPGHDHSTDHHSSRRLPALEQPHLAASFNASSGSSSALRLDQSGLSASFAATTRLDKPTTSSKPNKCRCTIL